MVTFVAPVLRQNWAYSIAIRERTGFWIQILNEKRIGEKRPLGKKRLAEEKAQVEISVENGIRTCAIARPPPLYRIYTSGICPAVALADARNFASSF